MLPIELPMLTKTFDTPALGTNAGGNATPLADDAAGAGLFAFLKESFAAALAEVNANQDGLQNGGTALPLKASPLGEEPSQLPISLTHLVEIINSNDESDILKGQLLKLFGLDQSAFQGQEFNPLSDLVVPTDLPKEATTEEAMPLIDTAVIKKDDQALMQWLSSMGISDKKIQTRALERWLKLQHVQKAGPSASGLKPVVAALANADVPAPGLETATNKPVITPAMPQGGGHMTLDTALPPQVSPMENDLTGTPGKGAAQLETTAATPSEPKTTKLETSAQYLNRAIQTSANEETLNHAGKRQEMPLKDQRDPAQRLPENGAMPSKSLTDQDLDLANEVKPGNAMDPKHLQKAKLKDFQVPGASHSARSEGALPEGKPADGQPLTAANAKVTASHPSVVHANESMGGENTGERSVSPSMDPILENATLAKAESGGQVRRGGIRAQDVQSFMRQHAPEVMTQIVDKAVVQVRNGQKEMQVQLKPSFLGQMKMRIVTENQQVMIRILTESPVVKEAIENHLYQLKADLSNHGLTIDRVEVFVSSDAHQQENRDTANAPKEDRLDREERQAKREKENERQSSGDPQGHRTGQTRTGGIDYFA
jgi:flagellar hook-length control protein FliK